MSGNLFKKSSIPPEPIKAEYAEYVRDSIINEILDIYPQTVCVKLGSVGKKNGYNGDIDIGIQANDINMLYTIINDVFNYTETVCNKSIYIVSMNYPYTIEDELKYVAVDFILVHNVEYTNFRYYCPNYKLNESQYKVGTKIMFVGTILNHCIFDDETTHYKYEFSPIGLLLHINNKNDNVYKTKFITYNPQKIVDIMFNDCTPDICNSIETLWDAIHTDKFKYPNEVKYIEIALFVQSYIKGWEEQVKPENFNITYWDNDTIHNLLNQNSKLRKLNLFLNKLKYEKSK